MIQLTPRVDIDHFENHWRNVFLANLGKKNLCCGCGFDLKIFRLYLMGGSFFVAISKCVFRLLLYFLNLGLTHCLD